MATFVSFADEILVEIASRLALPDVKSLRETSRRLESVLPITLPSFRPAVLKYIQYLLDVQKYSLAIILLRKMLAAHPRDPQFLAFRAQSHTQLTEARTTLIPSGLEPHVE